MLSKHKQPSLEAGLLIILVVISIFSIGFLSEGKVTGMAVKEESLEKVTGNMVEVTGMGVKDVGGMGKVTGRLTSTSYVKDKIIYFKPEELKQRLLEAKPDKIDETGWRYFKIKDSGETFVVMPTSTGDSQLYYLDEYEEVDSFTGESLGSVPSIRPVYLDTWNHKSEVVDLSKPASDKYDNLDSGAYIRAKIGEELNSIDSQINGLTQKQKQLNEQIPQLKESMNSNNEQVKATSQELLTVRESELKSINEELSAVTKEKESLIKEIGQNKDAQTLQDDINAMTQTKQVLEDQLNKPGLSLSTKENTQDEINKLALEIQTLQGIVQYKSESSTTSTTAAQPATTIQLVTQTTKPESNQPLISRSGSEWIVKDSQGVEQKFTDMSTAKNKFIEEMRIYLKGKIDEAQASATAQIARNYNDQIEKVLAEMSRSTSTDISYYNGKIAQVERLVEEMNAKLRPPSEQVTYLSPTASELDRTTAQNSFNQNPNNEEVMKALADGAPSNQYAKELLAILAFENGKGSEAYKQLSANGRLTDTKNSVDAALNFKEKIQKLDPTAASKLNIDSNGILYDITNNKYVKIEYTISSGKVVFQYEDNGPTLIAGKPVELTGLAYVAANLADGYTIDQSTGIIKDGKGNVYGKINEIAFTSTSTTTGDKFQPTNKHKSAPSTLSDGTPITAKTGWLTEDGKRVYEAGGKLYSEDTDWTKATKNDGYLKTTNTQNPVKVRTTEPIGETDDKGIITKGALIRKTIEIDQNGVMSTKTGDLAIVPSGNPTDTNFNNDIPIDKETYSMIKKTIGAKGTVTSSKNDMSGAEIKFTNKDGQDTTIIRYSAGYKIEANKLTGIKSQTDFKYSQDIDHDGKISEEEKEAEKSDYTQLTTRFTATEETDGKINKFWYTTADGFRFGNDGIYFADVYMQAYDINTGKPEGAPVYYYIEGKKEEDAKVSETNILLGFNKDGILFIQGGNAIKVKDGKAYMLNAGSMEYSDDVSSTVEGKRALKRASQSTSRRWFANLEFKLTQFRGLSGWSQLIFSDETLASWREGVDKLFASAYLGTDYWVSGICSKYIPKEQKGTMTMKTKDGLFDVIAHAEGEITRLGTPNGTAQYIYKLTFSVRNPKGSRYDKLKFNVYLEGERVVKLYGQDIEIKDGDSFNRGSGKIEKGQVTYDKEHGKPIVKYSNTLYNKICIRFEQGIINAEGKTENEVCNAIVEYTGSPTKYEKKVIGTTAAGTPITEGASEPYQEADF